MDNMHLLALGLVLMSNCHFTKGIGTFDDVGNKFRQQEFLQDEKEHIKEHIKEEGINPEGLTNEQLDFYYFRLHDADENQKLDGLEILKAFFHVLEHSMMSESLPGGEGEEKAQKVWRLVHQNIIGSVDKILEEDDLDGDGYLDYAEYANSRRTKAGIKTEIGAPKNRG